MIQASWSPALYKMDMIDHLSLLEAGVFDKCYEAAFWHDPNNQLGRRDADIEIHAETTCFYPTLIYF